MAASSFDTLQAAKALRNAGFDEPQAEAVVDAVDDAVRACTTPLERGIATIADSMTTKEYVDAALARQRAEIAVEFRSLYRHLWVMGTGYVAVTVALVKLLP